MGEYNDFLSAPYNYLLTLNVDWFSPFDHGCYSVGAIYLTIQNHDDVIDQRHRPGGKSCTNPAVRAAKVTSVPNTSICGYIN